MVSVAESGMEEIPLREEESPEYRILMAYAQRTLPASKFTRLAETLTGTGNGQEGKTATSNRQEGKTTTSNGQEGKTARLLSHKELKTKKTRKKSLSKRLIPKCLRPQTDDQDHPYLKAVTPPEERWAQAMARRVQGIMKRSIKMEAQMGTPEGQSGYRMFRRVSSVEADSDNEDELIAQIVQILRSSGDQLNEKIQQDQTLQAKMQSFWSYGFFSKITEHFLTDAVGQSEPEEEKESEQQQVDRIALCMHTTTALSALECQPMNRVLGFGVRYLRENYSSWIQSHGGLEKVMEAQDGEEVE